MRPGAFLLFMRHDDIRGGTYGAGESGDWWQIEVGEHRRDDLGAAATPRRIWIPWSAENPAESVEIFPNDLTGSCRNGRKTSAMDTITSADAADILGVNPQKFHRLVAQHGIAPALEAPGLRGAKFWLRRDIERLATTIGTKADVA